MATSELRRKDLRSYGLYFAMYFAGLTVIVDLLRMSGLVEALGLSASAAQVLGQSVVWATSLNRLADRFYSGQKRPTLPSEAGYLAAAVAVLASGVDCASQVVLMNLGFMASNSASAAQNNPVVLFLMTFVGSFLVNLLMLRVFLLPAIQARLFDCWRQLNR